MLLRPTQVQHSHPGPAHSAVSPQPCDTEGARHSCTGEDLVCHPWSILRSAWGHFFPFRPAEAAFPGSEFALSPSAAASFRASPSRWPLPLPVAWAHHAMPDSSFLWLAKALKCCGRGASPEPWDSETWSLPTHHRLSHSSGVTPHPQRPGTSTALCFETISTSPQWGKPPAAPALRVLHWDDALSRWQGQDLSWSGHGVLGTIVPLPPREEAAGGERQCQDAGSRRGY